ncbi:MAG TPA: NUDIX hydrolase [Phycisphaerae bacterium]
MSRSLFRRAAAAAELADTGLRCPECDYNLTGVQGAVCPECGRKIDPTLEPAAVSAGSGAHRALVALLTMLVGLLACTAAVVFALSTRRSSPGLIWESMTFLAGAACLALFALAIRLRLSWPLRMTLLPAACTAIAALQIAASLTVVIAETFARSWGVREAAVLLAFFSIPGWVLLVARWVAFRPATPDAARTAPRAAAAEFNGAAPGAAPFVVEACGRFEPGQVRVEWIDQPRPTTALLETLIVDTWCEKQAHAAQNGQLLYNGALARLIALNVQSDPGGARQLRLLAGPTDYRDFVGTNLYNAHLLATLGSEFFSNPIGTTAAVITSDGYLLYGRRNLRVAFHGGYLHTFGGGLEPADRDDDGTFDVFAALRRELREELHLAERDVAHLICTGVVRDVQIHQPEVLFDAYVGLPRREILERWDPEALHQEHQAIEFCHDEPDALVPFIHRAGKIAPVAIASLLLHGRLNWGQDWYESAAYVLFGELPAEVSVLR